MTATEDLIINQGADFLISFQYLEDDAVTPVDLTGYTARMQIRPNANSTTVYFDGTTENGRIVITPAEGVVSVNIPNSETTDMNFMYGAYDLEIVSDGGVVTRLVQGKVVLSKEVTK